MSSKRLFVICFFAVFMLAACSKHGNPGPVNDNLKNDTNVYVAGSTIAPNGYVQATYWKNGTPKILHPNIPGKLTPSQALAVATNGHDVYLVGYTIDNGNNTATIWKNSTETFLGAGVANGIFINGDDVYVCGTLNNAAVYWKNGTVTNLDYDSGSDARSIFVKDNDVYITGTINTPLGTYALYWKNGKAVTLGPGDVTLVFGNSIYVDGTDVYVAGTAYRAPVAGAATYWKNGEATTLGHFGRYSEADFITVHNGETYVLGYRDSVTNDVPIYWKNNAQVATPNIYPDYSAFSAIAFDKANTLYFLRQTGSFSYYDKNGKSTRLAGNGDAGSFAYAIALSQY